MHPGDSVKKGDELLLLDSPDFGGAEADYARARTALTQTEHSLERQQDLAAHGIVGQREVEQAKTDRDSALSDFNRTKDRLRLLGMDPDKTTLGSPLIVRSPLTGKVLDILAATGEFRNDPTAPLMTVADLSDIWVTANVQEKDIHFVHRGDPAVATFAPILRRLLAGRFYSLPTCSIPIPAPRKFESRIRTGMAVCVPPCLPRSLLKTWDTKELTVPTTALVLVGRQDHRVCSGFPKHL